MYKARWMGYPMKLKLSHIGLQAQLANHCTTRGAQLHGGETERDEIEKRIIFLSQKELHIYETGFIWTFDSRKRVVSLWCNGQDVGLWQWSKWVRAPVALLLLLLIYLGKVWIHLSPFSYMLNSITAILPLNKLRRFISH